MPGAEAGAFRLAACPGGGLEGRFAPLDALEGVVHVVTTRQSLDADQAARDRPAAAAAVARRLGLAGMAFCRQVHGAEVLRADRPGEAGDADGLVTAAGTLGVLAFSADCPLLLVADRAGRAVGAAHSSWRGTLAKMPTRIIEAMTRRMGCRPSELVAGICPSAGPCCYEVGGEVLAAAVGALGLGAERFFRARRGGKYLFDLPAACRDQLLRAGLRRSSVHVAGICTICRSDLFPSYRVEGPAAGRFIAAVGLLRRGGRP